MSARQGRRVAAIAAVTVLFTVCLSAQAAAQALTLGQTPSTPLNLDLPETYTLTMSVPADAGVPVTALGPVTDTLPPGTVFGGASPAADCQPGCVGTTPATVTWTSPCALPIGPGSSCSITVNVTFPSGTFPSGTNVTNAFTADATFQGEPPVTFGPSTSTVPVTTFVPTPDATLGVAFGPGSPAPPVLDQDFGYALAVVNAGNVALDALVLIDTVPVEMTLSRVTTGRYTGLAGFGPGEGVRVSYEKNTAPGVFTLWGSSPNTTTDTTLTAPPPGLGAGEYITRVRWEYGQAAPGMAATASPVMSGRLTNPDNTGGPVAVGDSIQNCAALSAVYTAGPTNVIRNACRTFALIAGPAMALQAPDSTPLGSTAQATAELSGGDPTGSIRFDVYAAGDTACSSLPLFTSTQPVDGVGPYTSAGFPADAAGAYKWVASYGGDALHAGVASACTDPAGAFAVVAPPSVAASFGAAAIEVGASTSLSFTITHPSANTVPQSDVALEDALPAGLAVASPNGLSGSCGAGTITAVPGSQSVTLAGGTIPVGGSCAFSVDVTGTAPGPVTNTTGAVQSANGGTGDTATASLTVLAPTVTTVECDESVTLGDEATCTATVSADAAPAGTVAFASDGTGTFAPATCTLEPISADAAACDVRYAPSEPVPEDGRDDLITAEYAPTDGTHAASSGAPATLNVRRPPVPPPPTPPTPPVVPVMPEPVLPVAPVAAATAQQLARACSPDRLVLLAAVRAGRRVRFGGAADPAQAGQPVAVRALPGGTLAARATVQADGSFAASGRLARQSSGATRYRAELGERRSLPVRLARRLTASLTERAGTITIRGRVSPPLRAGTRVAVERLTDCGAYEVVARVRPDARGRFRATLPRPAGGGAALYRARTRVLRRSGGPGTLQTYSLTLGVDRSRE